jgi:hypothetical protein
MIIKKWARTIELNKTEQICEGGGEVVGDVDIEMGFIRSV